MAEGGTSQTDGKKKKKQEDPVRFRRWIAMTPDCKWREFRGTAGMVDVGRGNDLVELVDKMMTNRMLLHAELSEGWCVMRRGLTPFNAGWIFSEMIAGVESLHKFEIENFSKKNSWARPKERRELPCYLSDLPVKDGSVSENEEAVNEFQEHMEMLFGRPLSSDFKDEMLRKIIIADIATSARERRVRKSSNQVVVGESRNARTNATRSGTRSSSLQPVDRNCLETPILRSTRPNPALTSSNSESVRQPVVETPILKSGPSANVKPYELNATKVCSGIGIVIDRNCRARIIMTDNYIQNPSEETSPEPEESTSSVPPLLTTNLKAKEKGEKLMTFVVTRNTNGEIISCEYAPVSFSDIAEGKAANSYPVKNYPEESLDFSDRDRNANETSTQQNWVEIANSMVKQKPIPETPKKRPPSDSGLSSTSEAVILSTGSCTPVTSENPEKEKSEGQSSDTSSKCSIVPEKVETAVVEPVTPKIALTSLVSFDEKKASLQTPSSYASVAGKRVTSPNVRNSSGSPAAAVVMEHNPLREEKKEPELGTSQNGEKDKSPSNNNDWILVKPKNVSESNGASSSTTSLTDWPLLVSAKPHKPEKPNSMLAVAENWDKIVVDEEAERQQELKRLKKQKQRAAKVEKEKEEKRLQKLEAERVENVPVNDTAPVTVSGNPIRVVALRPIPMIVVTEVSVEPEKEEEEGSYDPVTGQYSDGHIFHEYEDEGGAGDKKVEKDAMFLVAEEHAKIVFRILWFDNNKKLEKCALDAHNRQRLQDALDLIRAMHDRIDIAGQMIVYRIGRKMSSMKELNIVNIARNLIDMTRHTFGNDVIMAKSLSNIIVHEKIMKNFIYEKHIHTILTLPTDFLPKLEAGNTNTRAYKEITMLANLFTKRVSKVYEELCGLYEFRIEKDRKRSRRGY